MSSKFQIGQMVRENRQGAKAVRIIDIRGNILVTDECLHNLLHVTKAVKA